MTPSRVIQKPGKAGPEQGLSARLEVQGGKNAFILLEPFRVFILLEPFTKVGLRLKFCIVIVLETHCYSTYQDGLAT